MQNVDIYIKVEADLNDDENVKRFSEELSRIIKKVYGVRKAEVTNVIHHTP
jgi:hypothetical protein